MKEVTDDLGSVSYVDAVRFAVEDAETGGELLQVEGGHMKLDLHRAEDAQEADTRAKIAMATDPTLDYGAAIKFVVAEAEDRDGRIQFAGADPESLKLHEEILALIEKERLAGRKLTFLQAAQRIERERRRKTE